MADGSRYVSEALVAKAKAAAFADGKASMRAGLEAVAGDIAAAAVAGELRRLAAYYPAEVFPEGGTSRDAIAGTALRTVLTANAQAWERGEEQP